MSSKTVKYFKKISETAYEPLATSKKELEIECWEQGLEYCLECKAWVEPEGILDATGLRSICPFCGDENLEL